MVKPGPFASAGESRLQRMSREPAGSFVAELTQSGGANTALRWSGPAFQTRSDVSGWSSRPAVFEP